MFKRFPVLILFLGISLWASGCTREGRFSLPEETEAAPGVPPQEEPSEEPAPSQDTDQDGVPDSEDNCLSLSNTDQADSDEDGMGNDCDICPDDPENDADGDGVCGDSDVCPDGDDTLDTDSDGIPNGCDICEIDDLDDSDKDGVCDSADICPGGDDTIDTDGDGTPDDCDVCPFDVNDDSDGDQTCDSQDPCPNDPQNDEDDDGVCGDVDNCPEKANPDQADRDGNGIGDVCEDAGGGGPACPEGTIPIDENQDGQPEACCADENENGICDSEEPFDPKWICPDGSPAEVNDWGIPVCRLCDGGDRVGGVCLPCLKWGEDQTVTCPEDGCPDEEGDGVCDWNWRCLDGSPAEMDQQGLPVCNDNCLDARGGFVPEPAGRIELDLDGLFCPVDSCSDTDQDTVCDTVDICQEGDDSVDSDGDGRPDGCDACPNDPNNDSDDDGVCDPDDVCHGSDDRMDSDGDGIADGCDACPNDPENDADGDGICGNIDVCSDGDDRVDSDADGVPDGCDTCAGGDDHQDSNGNGIPDACDLPCETGDADGDGVCDDEDICPAWDNRVDLDQDGVPDGCDNCFDYLNPDQADGDEDGLGDACDFDFVWTGWSVSDAGDLNEDGYDDILVGAISGRLGARVLLYYGPVEGRLAPWDADLGFFSEQYEGIGYAVSSAGDMNNDGHEDILIGAPYYSSAGGTQRNRGEAYLVLGPVMPDSGDFNLANAYARFIGEISSATNGSSSLAGGSLSEAGDVNGDGFDDLLIGSPGLDRGGKCAGGAYLVYGPVAAGDYDLATADVQFLGKNPSDSDPRDSSGSCDTYAAYSVSGDGDFNGDGLKDVLIGAPIDDRAGFRAGAAYLVYGSQSLAGAVDLFEGADVIFLGENGGSRGVVVGDEAGRSVALVGDVNGDGFDDLLIGAPTFNDEDSGAAYLVYGSAALSGTIDLSSADAQFLGEETEDFAGCAVAGAGDVNGDGFDDLIVGAPGQQCGGVFGSTPDQKGKTYLILGGDLHGTIPLSQADLLFEGEGAEDGFGTALSTARDTNADGLADFIVGAPGAGSLLGGTPQGRVHVFLGEE